MPACAVAKRMEAVEAEESVAPRPLLSSRAPGYDSSLHLLLMLVKEKHHGNATIND